MQKDLIKNILYNCKKANIVNISKILELDERVLEQIAKFNNQDLNKFKLVINVALAGYSTENLLEILKYLENNDIKDVRKIIVLLYCDNLIKNGTTLNVLELINNDYIYKILMDLNCLKYNINLLFAKMLVQEGLEELLDDEAYQVLTNEALIKQGISYDASKMVMYAKSKLKKEYMALVLTNRNLIKYGLNLKAAQIIDLVIDDSKESLKMVSDFLIDENNLKNHIALYGANLMVNSNNKLQIKNIFDNNKIKNMNNKIRIAELIANTKDVHNIYWVLQYINNFYEDNEYYIEVITRLCNVVNTSNCNIAEFIYNIIKQVHENKRDIRLFYLDIFIKNAPSLINTDKKLFKYIWNNYYMQEETLDKCLKLFALVKNEYQAKAVLKILATNMDIDTLILYCETIISFSNVQNMLFVIDNLWNNNIIMDVFDTNQIIDIIKVFNNMKSINNCELALSILNDRFYLNRSISDLLELLNMISNVNVEEIDNIKKILNKKEYQDGRVSIVILDYYLKILNLNIKECCNTALDYIMNNNQENYYDVNNYQENDLVIKKLEYLSKCNQDNYQIVIKLLNMNNYIIIANAIEYILEEKNIIKLKCFSNLDLVNNFEEVDRYIQIFKQVQDWNLLPYICNILNNEVLCKREYSLLVKILINAHSPMDVLNDRVNELLSVCEFLDSDVLKEYIKEIKKIGYDGIEYANLMIALGVLYKGILDYLKVHEEEKININRDSRVEEIMYYDTLIAYCDNNGQDIDINKLKKQTRMRRKIKKDNDIKN